MKKTTTILFALLTLPFAASCTDTTMARWGALGDPAKIVCYSGTELIYEGKSTGKVESPQGSDGYRFKDAKTQWLTEVSGNCIIQYGTGK